MTSTMPKSRAPMSDSASGIVKLSRHSQIAMSLASISLGWRKIKADLRGELTETSIIGSIFSVAAACLIIFLVYSQVDPQSYLECAHCLLLTYKADKRFQNNKERIERCIGPLQQCCEFCSEQFGGLFSKKRSATS
jgi:hypothetical protein